MGDFTPTKHDASTINNGMQFNNGDIPQKEAFNNTIENSLYAVQQSDEAIKKVKEFEETEPLAKGTVVFENGQAQVNWDADTKLDKTQCNLQFNQLIPYDFFTNLDQDIEGLKTHSNGDGTYSVKGVTRSLGGYDQINDIILIPNHKYYLNMNVVNNSSALKYGALINGSYTILPNNTFYWTNTNSILKLIYYATMDIGITINSTIAPILIDITTMFGAGNEPQTVEEVQKYIPQGVYYPYTDKPNRDEVNSLSMCPSGTTETFISENVFTLKQAPANGYVVLNYEGTVTDISLFSRLEKYGATKLDNAVYKSADGIYYANLPVAKGDWVTYAITKTDEPTSFSINFVYAKEV